MTLPHPIRTALLTGTASMAFIAGAHAQDAEAVADRFVALMEEAEDGGDVTYQNATGSDGDVTISGLTFTSPSDGGETTMTVDLTVLENPVLGDANLEAEAASMSAMTITNQDGSTATIEAISLTGLILQPKSAETESRVDSATMRNAVITGKDASSFEIAAASYSGGQYVGDVPTDITFAVQGISLERGDMEGEMDQMFDSLGVDSILASVAGEGSWSQADSVLGIDNLSVDIQDLATMTLMLQLGGVTEQTFTQIQESPMAALSPLTLVSFSLDIEDGPLADQAIETRAAQMGVSAEDLRTTGIVTSKQMLMMLGENAFRGDAESALESFISNEKDRLMVSASPAQPVPVLAVGLTAQTSPDTIPTLLNMRIAAE